MQLTEYEGVMVDIVAGKLYIDFVNKGLQHNPTLIDEHAPILADKAYFFAHLLLIARDRYMEKIEEL